MSSAWIVQGVGESTGCRFLTKVLIKCGIYGQAGHTQEFQPFMYNDSKFAEQVRQKNLKSLVVRQSFPHGSNLPSLYNWYHRLKKSGFDNVYTIISVRSQPAQIVSTLDNGHIKNNPVNKAMKDPNHRIKQAHLSIFGDLARIDNGNYTNFVVVNLGDLATHPYVNLRYMLESVNVPVPSDFDYGIVKDVDTSRLQRYKNNYFK